MVTTKQWPTPAKTQKQPQPDACLSGTKCTKAQWVADNDFLADCGCMIQAHVTVHSRQHTTGFVTVGVRLRA